MTEWESIYSPEELTARIAALREEEAKAAAETAARPRPQRRTGTRSPMSPQARARLSEAQRRRIALKQAPDNMSPLRAARVAAQLTQEQAAAKVGVSRKTLSQIENGRRPASRETRRRIKLAFGIEVSR